LGFIDNKRNINKFRETIFAFNIGKKHKRKINKHKCKINKHNINKQTNKQTNKHKHKQTNKQT